MYNSRIYYELFDWKNNYKLKSIVNLCSNIYDDKQNYFKKTYFYSPPYFPNFDIKKIFESEIR